MERKIPESPYSPASLPPENLFNPPCQRFLSPENHPQTPLMASHDTSDQTIESAFSGLTLSPDFRPPSQTPSFLGLPVTLDGVASAESVPLPMAFGERQQASFWAQSPSNNGGVSGLFGAHQRINVGPEAVNLLGTGPNLDAGDPLKLMNYNQRRDFYDAGWDNYEFSSLHGKKPLSRKASNSFPIVPSAQQSNLCIDRLSLLYSNHQLFQWQQELTPENMRGRVVALAKDQSWSGILNSKLDEGLSEEKIEMILAEAIEFLGDLMKNQFGSHFVQKLFAACNEDQRTRVIIALTKVPYKLISSCLNSYGARAMQKLLEKLVSPQQVTFVTSALSFGTVALATDPNGQHVFQYCVKNFAGEYNKQLFSEIAGNCFKIATNRSGCCVIQSCVENSNGEARKQLISEIKANALHLAEDPYGNYVVQHLIGMRMPEVTVDLLRQFQGHFVHLSCNKYASNVVEKFLLESENHLSATIIMELLTNPNATMLLNDPYGNFVIQSALSASKGHVRDALLNFVRVNAHSMQSNLYGKKILAWIEKRKLRMCTS